MIVAHGPPPIAAFGFKHSLSNAATGTSWERLAYWQTQRFWIEQSFKEAKSGLGKGHYEVRGWTGWHHHMARVCQALLLIDRTRATRRRRR